MASTLALDPDAWDLTVDADGNIATVSDGEQLAQDAASAIRLFAGELWFDTTQGIPYFAQILGRSVPLALAKAYFVNAAETVPGVVSAVCYITAITGRGVSGQVQVTDVNGEVFAAAF